MRALWDDERAAGVRAIANLRLGDRQVCLDTCSGATGTAARGSTSDSPTTAAAPGFGREPVTRLVEHLRDAVRRRLDLFWDLRRGILSPDRPFDAIIAEPLEPSVSVDLLPECRPVLRLGGTVRIGVPDLDRYVASYLGRDNLIDQVRRGRPTRAMALGEVLFLHGHRPICDFNTLGWALREAGLSGVQQYEFGRARIGPGSRA